MSKSSTSSQLSSLKKSVAPFEKNDRNTSIKQMINTLGPLFLLWAAAYFSLSVSYWLTLLFAVPAAGFVIRTFIIFHDCCHGSFFKNRKANDILGTITGVLTLVPYRQWKRSHSIHHAGSSNLDKRGIGDIWIMTVDEYIAAKPLQRFWYRIYRNPLVMFGAGPIAVFLIQYRFNVKSARRQERMNTYLTNVLIAALYAGMIWLVGWQAFLLVQLPIVFVSGFLGIWLFYVQHQFEDTFFEHEEEWSYVMAAVEGSSYYKLPKLLQWITGNIGFHHVHHLAPKVPNYNLELAHNATPPLQKATTITIGTSLKAIHFRLWDEENKGFVSFKEIKDRLRKPLPSVEGMKIQKPGLQAK
ncbi:MULTISPECIES: fatty acid desaturase [unclassified Paenibacillus]|uniref:fatty acid desaturase n=1 Tax=unclassified Paenibacillus TaxID=185978 RepID=UPI002405E4CC|nr:MULTISPECIES: fatty acid desaturase [unclassified Paenibacillus]MDF9842973.1 omega-6 fatty acid desaturase (delta-12 desaturase) [Paenibacillus sp. PastF-2]MDF9849561.1 omega-6 fatty acid desaturase (delta-12 desaturase) [Paenibacillus sp. PastM-2]MDF9856064.1 omega-6 fatty acid desaturase (delta-12 desaturase) [Paenibacillus sp. PastF-1]MDH6481404.1 omega-6 fatty acid desaturase (delta-12 desaturase) [Paenibacillus sp. PastH-2]MDH6508753.1 omega-6 fatty acid desaturase (delta-12 desaturase